MRTDTEIEILVFKTNIDTLQDVELVSDALQSCSDIISWSIDLEDIDKVLRIESDYDITLRIEQMINANGYLCLALE